MREVSFEKYLTVILMVLILVRPHPPALGPSLAVYLCDLLLILLLSARVLFSAKIARSDANIGFVLLSYILVILLFSVAVFSQQSITLVEWAKFSYFLIIVWFMSNLYSSKGYHLHGKIYPIVYSIFFISLIQLFETPILYEFITALWGDEKLRGLSTGSQRVYASFYNANWFGISIGMLLIYFLQDIFLKRKIEGKDLVVTFMLLLMIFLSGSRSAWLSTIVGFVSVLLLNLRTTLSLIHHVLLNFKALGVLIFFVLTIPIYVTFFGAIDFDLRRLNEFVEIFGSADLEQLSTANSRFDSWNTTLNYVTKYPLSGIGANISQVSPHNSYLYYWALFGVPLGSVAVLLLLFSMIICVNVNKTFYVKLIAVFPLILTLIVGAMTAEFLLTTQVLLTYFLLVLCTLTRFLTGVTEDKLSQ